MNKNYVQYGLIISAIMVVLSVLFYILNLSQEKWAQWVGTLVMGVGIVLASINFSKINDGHVTFGNVFMNGFQASLIIAVITVIFSVIMVLIFPDIIEKIMETSRLDMEKKGMPEEQIEQGINFARKFFLIFMVIGGIFLSVICGVIASVIGAAIARKDAK
ncbi:DUF4199 domain-containing protein [Chitinophaga varians]|uniref:DUF4199 domain-containing protein n=1 Tax=Chitinophaga varians TaxID=2202339 RepID=A0A847RSS0_9BACT|nr:DUF4199 domain-containing protein [Chitinophaga varians]NLR68680.1 DUF4199 domain-containing protein [Chitinophaga varians]